MYLGNKITKTHVDYESCGVFDSDFYMTDKLIRFGYGNLTDQKDNLLCKKGENIPFHEFHYSDSNSNGDDFIATKRSGKSYSACFSSDTLFCGYPHISFLGNEEFALNFLEKAREITSKWD